MKEFKSKFKSGDVVVVTKQGGWYEPEETYTLTEPYFGAYNSGFMGWLVKERPNNDVFIREGSIKLKPIKDSLVNGMRVKLRNESMWTVVDGTFLRLRPEFKHGMDWCGRVKDWNDNLEAESTKSDVMEIYSAPKMVVEYFEYHVPTELIWKRSEKSEAEIRLEAMQKQMQELQENMDKLQQEIKNEQS